MLDLLTEALAAAPSRCTDAEGHVVTDAEDALVRNGRVDSSSADGIGVRGPTASAALLSALATALYGRGSRRADVIGRLPRRGERRPAGDGNGS